MTEQEIQRAVQYVTASTSHDRDTVDQIIRTGLKELANLVLSSPRAFTRDTLLEYVARWTMKQTGEPEPLVREILGCAGRWLDELCRILNAQREHEPADPSDS